MVLSGRTRLRSLSRHVRGVQKNAALVIGLADLGEHAGDLVRAGFSDQLVVGERILPARVGPVSTFNAEGGEIVHRDRPMETAYRQIEWTWEQWAGYHGTETRSKIVDVPYKRYPRTPIPPPSVELSIAQDPAGEKVVITDPLAHSDANAEALLHRINLCRELFGEAAILTEDLEHLTRVEFRRLNWEVLPPGEMPWERLSDRLQPILDRYGKKERPVAEHRLRLLTEEHTPDFTAVGRAGFRGYLVFGFEGQSLYVVESLEYGNATYVFGENWERLSQLTKAEILDQDLQQDRVVHREGWEQRIRALLS